LPDARNLRRNKVVILGISKTNLFRCSGSLVNKGSQGGIFFSDVFVHILSAFKKAHFVLITEFFCTDLKHIAHFKGAN